MQSFQSPCWPPRCRVQPWCQGANVACPRPAGSMRSSSSIHPSYWHASCLSASRYPPTPIPGTPFAFPFPPPLCLPSPSHPLLPVVPFLRPSARLACFPAILVRVRAYASPRRLPCPREGIDSRPRLWYNRGVVGGDGLPASQAEGGLIPGGLTADPRCGTIEVLEGQTKRPPSPTDRLIGEMP